MRYKVIDKQDRELIGYFKNQDSARLVGLMTLWEKYPDGTMQTVTHRDSNGNYYDTEEYRREAYAEVYPVDEEGNWIEHQYNDYGKDYWKSYCTIFVRVYHRPKRMEGAYDCRCGINDHFPIRYGIDPKTGGLFKRGR